MNDEIKSWRILYSFGSLNGAVCIRAVSKEEASKEFKKQWKMLTITEIKEDRYV